MKAATKDITVCNWLLMAHLVHDTPLFWLEMVEKW
jgi:hypothetical protein